MSTELSRFSTDVPSSIATLAGQDTGIGELSGFIRPKYLRIVQGIGKLSETYDPQTVLKMGAAGNEVYLTKGEHFYATPLFWWKEWGLFYHKDANVDNPCKERTLDPNHPLAIRTKDRTLWNVTEPDLEHNDKNGNPLPLSYRETISFILSVYDKGENGNDDIVIASFRSGEYRTGANFGELIASRKDSEGRPFPIYTGAYKFSVGRHTDRSKSNTWFGFDIANAGFVPEDRIAKFKESFEGFRDVHASGLLKTDTSDHADDEVGKTQEDVVVSKF